MLTIEDQLCKIESIITFEITYGVGRSALPSVSVTINKEEDTEKIKALFKKYGIAYYSILVKK